MAEALLPWTLCIMDPEALQLQDTGLDQQLLQLLQSHNFRTCRDVLLLSSVDIMELLNIPYSRAEWLLNHVAMHLAPSYTTAAQLHTTIRNHSVRVLTGLQGLDDALRGGLPPGAITELVGPAGVGKSQMCYTIALQVALPRPLGGLQATMMYIDTEGKFSTQRLLEMASARVTAAAASGAAPALQGSHQHLYQTMIEPVLNRMLILKPASVEQLQSQLEALKQEVAQRDVKLVLLDSIAALLRTEHAAGDAGAALAARGEQLGRQATALKVLAEAHQIPVVVTNQVTARPSGLTTHAFQQQQQQRVASGAADRQGQLAAALGTKWAHAVNIRLILERWQERRFIKVAKSPVSANATIEYCISAGGVEQVHGTEVPQAIQQSALEVQIANEYAAW